MTAGDFGTGFSLRRQSVEQGLAFHGGVADFGAQNKLVTTNHSSPLARVLNVISKKPRHKDYTGRPRAIYFIKQTGRDAYIIERYDYN